jgi:intracellular septation protein A
MTAKRVLGFLRHIVLDFGALIVFWSGLYAFGIKPAIAATVVFILLDALYRWRWRFKVTRIYLLTSTLAVVFGAVDLYAAHPFMIKYEAVVTNTAVGLFFVAGARGEKSLIQEVAEKRQRGEPFPDRADVRYFFRLLTLVWAGYFLVRAALYFWLGWILPLERALAVRVVIGGVSLALMIGGTTLLGRRLFFLCRWLGLLPAVEAEPAQLVTVPASSAAGE